MNIESDRCSRISPIPAIEIKKRCLDLRAGGEKIIDLSIGDTDLRAPDSYLKGVKKAFERGLTHYTLSQGIPELRERIGDLYGGDADEVLVCAGGKEGIMSLFTSMVNPGDEVIIPVPAWPPFMTYTSLCDGRRVPLTCRLEDDFEPSIEAIREKITKRTKMLVLNSPNNPTGAVYPKETVRAAVELADDHGFLVLSDEIYSNFIYSGEFVSARDYGENVVVLDGFSKTYAMTGIRLCYLVGQAEIVRKINKIHGYIMGNAPSLAQYGALEVLDEDDGNEYRRTCRKMMRERRDIVHDTLSGTPGLRTYRPKGAFYMFPRYEFPGCSGERDSVSLCEDILERKKIALIPGTGFGADGHFRIAASQPADILRTGVERLSEYFEEVCHERQ